MGRQVGIYFTKEDAQEFLDFSKTTGDVVALPWKSSTPEFTPIIRIDDENLGFFLFNRGISSNLVTRYVPQQGYYVLDSLQSSLIEFSCSFAKGNNMFPGRIWAEFTFVNNERTRILSKEAAFSDWYDTIVRWIKKHSKRVIWTHPIRDKTSVIGYAALGAQGFYESGGRLAVDPPTIAKPEPDKDHVGRIFPSGVTSK